MTEIALRRIASAIFLLSVFSLNGFFCASPSLAQRNVVVVRPKEINDVLVNPGMGITTFQRFNGQEPNPPLTWSEVGPVAKVPQAATKPDFPDTSVAYCRWYWNVLEPEPGKFNWAIIDLAIDEARAHGQKLEIRLMPYSNQDPLPEWFRKSGAKRANKDSDKDGKIWQPDFSDPLYFKYWSELVAEAGARYDGNPYLDSVDISSVGYWGEGWSPYMPAFSVQKALIDIWLDAFQAHAALDELRRARSACLWHATRRRLAIGLLGRHAREIKRSVFPGRNVGDLSAADRAHRDSRRVAAKSGVARDLLHRARVEGTRLRRGLHFGPSACAGM